MTSRRLGVSAALVAGRLVPGDISLAGDTVDAIGLPPAGGGRIAAPGLVDIQVNGFAGVDVMGADAAELRTLARGLVSHGVTAWLPTLITASPSDTERALRQIATAMARWSSLSPADAAWPLGVHLEGPYLSAERLGTHPPEHRRDPDLVEIQGWCRLAPVVAVTIAPELPGGLEVVKALSADGVLVSLGHSNATAAEAHAAFDAGARTVTHLFNAMSPLLHREPGLPGAALARHDVVVQMVVDGHHLAADVVRLAWAAAAGRVVLVTDAIAAAGLSDGSFDIAGVPVEVNDGVVRNSAGALAGSALTLANAVSNACELGIDPAEALVAVTETPARLLRRPDIGTIRPGARADITVFDQHLDLEQTWLAGRQAERDDT
jgi:N-acetylglucosamine-6-phosphate deacetylase